MTATASSTGTDPSTVVRGAPPVSDMVWVPGGTFLMGSDKHYPEERPVHRVTVDGFWMDRAPVTNERFAQFVKATGYVTGAEVVPKAEDYPGALPDQLFAGSLVFVKPPGPVDLLNIANWWHWTRGADWRHPYGADSKIDGVAFDCERFEFLPDSFHTTILTSFFGTTITLRTVLPASRA